MIQTPVFSAFVKQSQQKLPAGDLGTHVELAPCTLNPLSLMGSGTIYIPQAEDDKTMSGYLKFNFTLSNLCPIMQAFEIVSEEGKPAIDSPT